MHLCRSVCLIRTAVRFIFISYESTRTSSGRFHLDLRPPPPTLFIQSKDSPSSMLFPPSALPSLLSGRPRAAAIPELSSCCAPPPALDGGPRRVVLKFRERFRGHVCFIPLSYSRMAYAHPYRLMPRLGSTCAKLRLRISSLES